MIRLRRGAKVPIANNELATVSTRSWHRYSLALHWVTHAESKAIAALTATAFVVIAAVTLASTAEGFWSQALALGATTVGLVAAIQFAIALLPRLGNHNSGESSVYFGDIVDKYPLTTGAADFSERFVLGVSDQGEELDDIASQVLANAHIASTKYKWVGRGLRWLVGAILLAIASGAASLAVILIDRLN